MLALKIMRLNKNQMLQYDNFIIKNLHFGQDQRKYIPTLKKKMFIMILEYRDDEQGLAITKNKL